MVLAQHRLVTEGLGVRHLRLVLGNSMGGMHAWTWGVKYPDEMDALVPLASQPTEMSSRNWMMRRLMIDTVRNDPDWKNGDYTSQPKALGGERFYGIATNGGTLAYQAAAPTRERGRQVPRRAPRRAVPGDANDFMYQWDASRDYNASPGSIASRRRCWPSTRPTTSAIRPRPA